MSNSAGVDVQVTDSQETACELVLEQLKHADKILLDGIEAASEVIDLIAAGDSSSKDAVVEKKCLEFLNSIKECQEAYTHACESQAGVSLPYAVHPRSNPS